MNSWLDELISGALGALDQGNPVALLSLLCVTILTESGVPFPYIIDSVLFISGFHSGKITLQLGINVLVIFVGRQIGATIIYWLTRLLGITLTTWIERRFPKMSSRLQDVIARLHSKSIVGIAVTRLTGLLTLVSVASGLIKVRYVHLIAGVALSALMFDGALVFCGIIAGNRLQQFGFVPTTPVIIGLCIFMIAIVIAINLIVTRRAR
jgi:membrane protein DedA with SNARE-associated domain